MAALAYVPFLLSSPGRVSADSKQYLYLDPGAFLARAAQMWDPHIGAGTVPHQHLGYLFPMGPWFWLFDQAGVPDWVAQRLWLGTLSLAAALGARWLFRQLGTGSVGALAGALVYMLTPYQLAFTARMSVLLLPWAALPWLVGLTMRATRTRSWRAPALLALVLVGAGGVNASSLLLVGVAPLVWLVLEAAGGATSLRRVLAALARVGALALGVSVWWLLGVRIQGRFGLPVLQLTENVRTVADASTPGDLLRGLGNWFFYGRDRTGYSVDQASAYAHDAVVVALSFAVPIVAVAVAFVLRWAHRSYFVLLVVVGTVIGVGAWPADDLTPYGRIWTSLTTDTSLGLAFRNTPRVVPIITLGLAGLLAGAVGAVRAEQWRRLAGAGVVVLAGGALLPVWQDGYLTEGMTRPESVPGYWRDAVADLDGGDHGTRILAVPGSSFAAYEWGTTVDPITPGLTDRPFLAREVLPYGTIASVNLLDALDRRMQQGTFEAGSLAPIARLLGVGTVLLRADLEQAGRFDTPPPGSLWEALAAPAAPGLGRPRTYGPSAPDPAAPAAGPPALALFDVQDPQPIVRTAPTAAPVVLAGDGDGLVDAAAAGLLEGSGLVLQVGALDGHALDGALDAGAHLVLTDSNRRRIQTWFYSLRDTRGPTEVAGETEPDPTGYDARLDPFPGRGDESRTVVEQVGARVTSTGGGGPERPEDRAAHAVDGDLATAWRVGGPDPRGQSITIVPDAPVPATEVRLVQPSAPDGGRALAQVRLSVDGGTPITVDLDERSRQEGGQPVPIPPSEVHELRVEITGIRPASPGGPQGSPVGLAEIVLGRLSVSEVVRPPIDLLRRVGERLDGHSLDVVLTRLRLGRADPERGDDEAHLDRRLELPLPRRFALRGTARPAPSAEPASPAGTAMSPQNTCRDDLLTVDGQPLVVRLEAAGSHFDLVGCEPVELTAGSHRIESTPGARTGLDVDRLVLSSDPDGAPAQVAPRDALGARSNADVTHLTSAPTAIDVEVSGDGQPFWLVLGQSNSDGWHLGVAGASVGERTLVDGYANGWLITPDGPGRLSFSLRWTPQRLIWLGYGVSLAALMACFALLWRSRGKPDPPRPGLTDAPMPAGVGFGGGPRLPAPTAAAVAVLVGLGTAVVAPPAVALAAGAVTAGHSLARPPRWWLAVLATGALAASRLGARPSLAWLTVALLVVDLLVEAAGSRLSGRAATRR